MENKTTDTKNIINTKPEWKKPELKGFDTKKTHGGAGGGDEDADSKAGS